MRVNLSLAPPPHRHFAQKHVCNRTGPASTRQQNKHRHLFLGVAVILSCGGIAASTVAMGLCFSKPNGPAGNNNASSSGPTASLANHILSVAGAAAQGVVNHVKYESAAQHSAQSPHHHAPPAPLHPYAAPNAPPWDAGWGSAAPAASPGVRYVVPAALVQKVPDGDTFTVSYTIADGDTNVRDRVRIRGMDSPETKQAFGPQAGEIGRALAIGQHVTLHVYNTDRYKRIIADVFLPDGRNYALEMLRAGAAWHYKQYDKRPEYANAELQARSQRVGLWRESNPLPPWEFRKQQRAR